MKLEEQNILFILRATQHGGTENIVIQLCETFKSYVKKIVVASSNGINETVLKALGVKFYNLPDIERKDIQTIIHVRKKIISIIKKEKITVIHTHHRMAAFYCQIIPTNGITLINTSHTVFYDKKVLTQFSFRNMNLIACGNNVKDSLVQYQGIGEKRVIVIPNAVRPFKDRIKPIKEIVDIKNKGYIIAGVIGRLSYEKGVINLVEAAKNIKNQKIKYVIVGIGNQERYIRNRINEYGLNELFVFLGYRNDAQNVASQLDFLILPSLQEGLPLVPIESFSVATPVLATDVGGTAEIVKNEYNGRLIPPNDIQALTYSINDMIHSDLKTYGNNAYKTYIEKFSYNVFENNYLYYYKRL